MDDTWPTITAEEAFSGHVYKVSTEHSLENLVRNLVPHSNLAPCEFPILSAADKSEPMTVSDHSRNNLLKTEKRQAKESANLVRSDCGSNQKLLSLDDALIEVRKFNIRESKGGEKQEAKQALALKLGAKKPKNKSLSYNQLKEERKKQKMEAKQRRLEKKYDRLKEVKGGKIKKKIKKKLTR